MEGKKLYTILLLVLVLLSLPFISSSKFGVDINNPSNVSSHGVSITLPSIIASAVSTFIALTDTPSSYSGSGSNCVKVNAGETGLEFVACGGGGDFAFADFTNSFLTNISELTPIFNSTYNATYASYNETQIIFDNNASWTSTYNETYASSTGDNASWNETYADTKYASIEWGYNQSDGSYNETYNTYAYNQTYDINETQIKVSDNQITILESWLDTLMTTLGYIKSAIGDGQKNTTGEYLFNDTDTVYFNATKLNDTIRQIDLTTNSTFNQTYDDYKTNVSINYTKETFDEYDSRWSGGGVADGQKNTTGEYLFNDTDTIYLNDTLMNLTINQRIDMSNNSFYNATYDSHQQNNNSWNQTFADSLYSNKVDTFGADEGNYSAVTVNAEANYTQIHININNSIVQNISDNNASWTSTYNETYASNIDTNCSDGSCANVIYWDNESLLNVNSSSAWNDTYAINNTQMENNGGTLNILQSWFSSLFDSLFGGKTTDDLIEGTTNKYDNKSWNETRGNDLYPIKSDTFGADEGNYSAVTVNAEANYTQIHININNSIVQNISDNNASWTSTYNETYDGIIANSSINYTKETFDEYDSRWSGGGNASWNESQAGLIFLNKSGDVATSSSLFDWSNSIFIGLNEINFTNIWSLKDFTNRLSFFNPSSEEIFNITNDGNTYAKGNFTTLEGVELIGNAPIKRKGEGNSFYIEDTGNFIFQFS